MSRGLYVLGVCRFVDFILSYWMILVRNLYDLIYMLKVIFWLLCKNELFRGLLWRIRDLVGEGDGGEGIGGIW